MRESCRRAHFDRLRLFGVLPPSEGSVSMASLAVLVASAPSASFLPELLTTQQHDPFLQQVAEDVAGSNQGVWRDFFRNDQGFLCYLREGDAVPRIRVPKVSQDAVLHAANGKGACGASGYHAHGSQRCSVLWWQNLFSDVAHFIRS
jgi:hypothetical protein